LVQDVPRPKAELSLHHEGEAHPEADEPGKQPDEPLAEVPWAMKSDH
jgi:hypothetical protein